MVGNPATGLVPFLLICGALAGVLVALLLWAVLDRDETVPETAAKRTLLYLQYEQDDYVRKTLRDLHVRDADPDRVRAIFDSLAGEFAKRYPVE